MYHECLACWTDLILLCREEVGPSRQSETVSWRGWTATTGVFTVRILCARERVWKMVPSNSLRKLPGKTCLPVCVYVKLDVHLV